MIHHILPAGTARKKDPGVLSIKNLIDTSVPAGDTVRNSRGGLYVEDFKATFQSLSCWEASALGSSTGTGALGSSQPFLCQVFCRRHWENWAGIALSGGGKYIMEKGIGEGRVPTAGQH